jgi:hypothetical protein
MKRRKPLERKRERDYGGQEGERRETVRKIEAVERRGKDERG